MADNVAVTAGSGTTMATDERTINSVAVQVQRVYDFGASAFAASQVTVSNSDTSILAAADTRKRAVIVNRQTVAVYINGTTATTAHFRLDPGESLTVYTTGVVRGITSASYSASGDAKVHVIEETSA